MEQVPDLPRALIVAGPTCSGKSALALHLAERLGGVVINADSMQVYRELRVLTARPPPEDEARAPHALYGVRPAAEPGDAAWWRRMALDAMAQANAAGQVPILCGGTGLYLKALRDGLAALPPISEAARAEARAILAADGAAALHARLALVDAASADRLRPGDGQRIARAWEVWRGTGRPLSRWLADGGGEPAPWRFHAILLDPPREALRRAIAGRFDAMLRAGAVEEVRALLALGLDPALPAMRAHGVAELAAHLRGELSLTEAVHLTKLATGQYMKRQATWFRHHALADPHQMHTINARYGLQTQDSESFTAIVSTFIHRLG